MSHPDRPTPQAEPRPSHPKTRSLGFAVALLVLAADQLVKGAIIHTLALPRVLQIPVLPIFNLTWAENYGISLGFFQAGSNAERWILVGVTTLLSIAIIAWMLRESRKADILALGVVLGGATGNIVDRSMRGFVVDYADLHFGAFRPFLIFNLADVAITLGVLIILARSFLSREKRPEPQKDAGPIDPAAPET